MNEQSSSMSTQYRIGAVSRLTGISPDALRMWERRYGAVAPRRSPAGGRLYDAGDVERLRLLKQLVDAGDAIGEVANLDMPSLQARLTAAQRAPTAAVAVGDGTPCRVLIAGESLLQSMEAAGDNLSGLTLVAGYRDSGDFEARAGEADADVLVIEQTTLHEDTAARIIEWLTRARAAHAVVVYRYASAEALRRLPAAHCSVLRAPVDALTLQAHCLAVQPLAPGLVKSTTGEGAAVISPAPPRRYDDETLAQLATLSSTVKCECPRHLAELIAGLSGFERYSAECESRSPQDAALHAYLYATASQARHMIEQALDHIIELENIEL